MGVIKAKNSAGEWVNVASAEATTIHNELTGDLKSVNIEVPYGTESNTLDLSKYVNGSDDFFIIVGVTTTRNQGTEQLFAWWREDGKTRTLVSQLAYGQHANLNGIFPVTTALSFSYDEATGILTMNDDTYHYIENALLFYTGVKEA